MIKAVIFDFDGLIIDTETAWYNAYKSVYREQFDVDMPLDVWAKCIGTTFDAFNPYDYLEDQLKKPIDRKLVEKATKARHDELMQSQQVRPGVVNYLQTARELGLRVGLASSSTWDWVGTYLRNYGLIDYFETFLTADNVAKVKPDPELYIKSLESLNVKGHEAIAFEDSLHGLAAAKAAGAYGVVVPNEVTSFMNFERHDLRLSSMEEMPLQEVIQRINALT